MLPPETVEHLGVAGHDATTPALLGAHDLPDEILIGLATAESRIIVAENVSGFASVTTCPVVFVRKSWWPVESLAPRLAVALDRSASVNRQPGPWPHWLPAESR